MGNTGEIQEEIERWVSPSVPSPGRTSMPLSLNHVSFVCKSVPESVKFYEDVLGFVLIKRPSSFKFEGAWYVHMHIPPHIYIISPLSPLLLICSLIFKGEKMFS